MAHEVDFHTLEEDLFVLEHLLYGSRALSESYVIDRHKMTEGRVWLIEHGYDASKEDDSDWQEYSARLHGAVSNRLVSVSVKSRILWDAIHAKFPASDLLDYQMRACRDLQIGELTGDKVKLSLRESWNKIIHGTKVELEWKRAQLETTKESIEYWSGVTRLSGEKQRKRWILRLKTSDWTRAMWNFHSLIEEDDGIDWAEFYT